jgi:hypothetical protein
MAMNYWRLKFRGERPADEIQSAIGRSGGTVLRIHFEGGETSVYVSAEKSAALKAAKATKASTLERINAGEVTKFT